MNKSILFYFLSLFSLYCVAQKDSACNLNFRPHEKASTMLFTMGYRIPLNQNAILNSGQGIYVEGGFNPGQFISKKIILGVYGGWAWRGSAWSTSFNSAFASDYISSLNHTDKNFTTLDKEIIESSGRLFSEKKGSSLSMPGCETNSFHNYSLYYGLAFKLPYRYSPILKIYSGSTRSYFMGNKIVTFNRDYNIFELRRKMYGCELIVFRGLQLKKHMNAGALSFYFEESNLKNSQLYFNDGEITRTLLLKDFTNPSFMEKHNQEITIGFRLSFCIL